MDFDNYEDEDEEFEQEGSSQTFYYCFGCFSILGVFDWHIPELEETEEFIKDGTGRVFSKKVCSCCCDTVKNGDMFNQVNVDNQLQEEEYIEIELDEPGTTDVDEFIKSMKITPKLNLRKKGKNEVKKRRPK